MEIGQLRTFVSLAQTRNFSRTGELLHLVQSGVSTRIRLLEQALGQRLFLRSKRKVELTPVGVGLLPYAQRILALCEEAAGKVGSLGRFENRLAIGSTHSLWHQLLLPSLLRFSEDNPRTALVIRSEGSTAILHAVEDGAIDVGIGYDNPRIPGLRSVLIKAVEVQLVASPRIASRRAAGQRWRREDLADLPLLTFEWEGAFQQWVRETLPEGYTPPAHLDLLSLMVALLCHGRGAAFMPYYAVAAEIESGRLVALPVDRKIRPPRRQIYVFYKEQAMANPPLGRWLALLKEALGDRGKASR